GGYHSVPKNAQAVPPPGASLAVPTKGVDWLSYLAWYTNGARWAFECIAEMRGYELDPVETPAPPHPRRSPAYRHLVESLRSAATAGDYERVTAGKLANHLRRVDEV